MYLIFHKFIFLSITLSLLSYTIPYDIKAPENKLPVLKLLLDGNNIADIENMLISKLLFEQNITIPSINISQNIYLIGNISLNIDDALLKITNFTNAELNITFLEKNDINFNINLLKGEMEFNYTFYSGLISSEGDAKINLKNISLLANSSIIQIQNKFEPEKKGPGIVLNSILVNDIEMEIIFNKNGTFEKFIKFFNKNLKKILAGVLENQINSKIILEGINNILYALCKNIRLNIGFDVENITDTVHISFSMNEEPLIKNNKLEIPLELDLLTENYEYCEKNNITLPNLINSSFLTENSINSIISQFFLNNILDFLYFYGKLNAIITNDTIGMSQFTVGLISTFIDEIKNGYQLNQTAEIRTKCIDSPILKNLDENFLQIILKENLEFFVYDRDGDNGTVAINADSNLNISINFYINDTDIQLIIKKMVMETFDVNYSNVGEIDTDRVITNFTKLIDGVLIFVNNNIKKKISEIELPISFYGMNLTNLIVQSKEEYLKVDMSPVLTEIIKYFKYYMI